MIGQKPSFRLASTKPAPTPAPPPLAAKPGTRAREAYRLALKLGKIKPRPSQQLINAARRFYEP